MTRDNEAERVDKAQVDEEVDAEDEEVGACEGGADGESVALRRAQERQ